jgi:hypothetical protein
MLRQVSGMMKDMPSMVCIGFGQAVMGRSGIRFGFSSLAWAIMMNMARARFRHQECGLRLRLI